MTWRRENFLKLACSAACAACLALGYAAAGKWLMLAPVALVWLGWVFTATGRPQCCWRLPWAWRPAVFGRGPRRS